MNKLYFFGLIFLLTVAACKKERACPPPYDEKACELIANATFPLMDISSDPDAWYEADIEGSISTMGTGYENEGFIYFGQLTSRTRTTDPELPPGTPKSYDMVQMKFSLYKPTEKYVGQSLTLLEFYSPGFDVDTINNLMSLANTLFSPGIKKIDDGTGIIGDGWLIGIRISHPIERAGQTGSVGTSMFTNSGYKEDPDNYFEITRSEAKDMGSFVRFTIWCNYKAELYNGLGEFGGKPIYYFGQIRSGKAKLYVDVNK